MFDHYDSYRYETSSQIMGGTRWAGDDEIREALSRVDLYDRHYFACGLPLISDGHTAYVNNTDSHGLIIGSTGSKKSRLFVMPMLEMIARAGESAIVTDPKGELYDRTSGLFSHEGYDIFVLNFRDPTHSHGWNPLHTAYTLGRKGQMDKALEITSDLSGFLYCDKPDSKADPFWTQKSRAVFQGLCQMMLEDEFIQPSDVTFSTVAKLATCLCDDFMEEDGDSSVLSLMRNYPEDSLARATLEQAMTGSDKTVANILTSMLAPLQMLFTNRSLMKMLSAAEIDFSTLGLRKSILYVIMPDEKTTLHPLVGMCIKTCYEMLINAAQHQKRGILPVRVNFLLDEFSNIPKIPDMSSMITAARSRNIRFYLIIQSMHQLRAKYGDDAYTLRGNCNDWVFLTSRELELLEELESLCGSDAGTGAPLISVSQLQRLNKDAGEALVLCGRMYPYLSHLADIDQYPFADIGPVPLPDLAAVPSKPFDYHDYCEKRIKRYGPPKKDSHLEELLENVQRMLKEDETAAEKKGSKPQTGADG